MDYSSEVGDQQAATPLARDVFKPRSKTHFKVIVGMSIAGIVAIGVVTGVMWQSNVFIARRQEVRSDASTQEAQSAQTVQVVQSAQLAAKDQRFGVGGDCGILKSMGMPWMFNWGGGYNGKFNDSELKCVGSSSGNMNTILTIGHADDWDETNGILDGPEDMKFVNISPQWQRATPEEEQAYNAMAALLAKHPTVYNSVKVLASIYQVNDLASQYPNAYWQIGNEPDWAPYFSPEDYAEYYKIFATLIRTYDPSAKIGIGGLAWPRYTHARKWPTGYTDWSLWRTYATDLGLINAGNITSVSISRVGNNDVHHVVSYNMIYRSDCGTPSCPWQNETQSYASVGNASEPITSFSQLVEAGVTTRWLTRGGKVYSNVSTNSSLWPDDSSAITIGQGPISSFVISKDAEGRRVQYVVRCKTWVNNQCGSGSNGRRLNSRTREDNGNWGPWIDLTSVVELVGSGDISAYTNYVSGNLRKQFHVRGGKLWFREGRKYEFKDELKDNKYIQDLIKNNPQKAQLYKDGAWFLLFLKKLRSIEAVSNLNFVNIHPYSWTIHNTQGINPGYSDDASIAAAVNDTKESVQHMYNLMQDSVVNLPNTPIVITEFSHAGDEKDKDCTSIDICEPQARFAKKYIEAVVPWLKQSNLVHKWLWFYAGPHGDTANSGSSNLKTLGTQLMYIRPDTQQPNVTAKAYMDAMNATANRDQVIPQLTKIENLAVSGNASLRELKVTITESQASAAYEYWYCLGKTAGACDLKVWMSRITRSKTSSLYPSTTVSGYSGTVYATVKVTDSTGNASQVVSGPITTLSL